ncbi:MAG: PhoPQ-activated protein PqaA family protein [Chthoniobacteraceae bacterium]
MKTLPILLLAWFTFAVSTFADDAKDAKTGPWKVAEWKTAPTMRWVDQTGPVHSLFYTSEAYKGHPTEVFAFYASPATLGKAEAGKKFPGVVLIHGGGGTAFAEWAWLWAQRGYAAIAMDLSGSQPNAPVYDPKTGIPILNQTAKADTRKRLPNGGPDQGHAEKFDSIAGDTSDQWPFHAAAAVIRAHSLLRSLDEVDAERTAVTGISWGGYTTCLVASLDDRFKAAVPVYGCGFLFEGESVQKPSIDKLGALRQRWVDTYDPSAVLPRCHVPILFVNGTNDVHYVLDSYEKSFAAVPGPKQMRIQVNMHHSHPDGWAPKEIGIFIDSHCAGGKPLPVAGHPIIEGEKVRLTVTAATPLKSAALHYTTDDGLRSKRTWKEIPATIANGVITAPRPPAEANTWFISVTDDRDAMVTTDVQFAKP